MRYIDISSLSPPQNWLTKANRLFDELSKCNPQERKAFLSNSNNQIWGEIKGILESLYGSKCWYCEYKFHDRAPYHVDHFRPKNGSKRVDHNGYWWLAYDYKNYRLACPTCNSSGKGDRFPIHPDSQRTVCIDNEYIIHIPLTLELPLLLDPTDPKDPPLLEFEPDGEVNPKYGIGKNSFEYQKVKTSIELYRLNSEPLKEARKSIQAQLKACLELCVLSPPEKIEEHLTNLVNLIEPKAVFSAFSNSRLKTYKAHSDYAWVVNLIEKIA